MISSAEPELLIPDPADGKTIVLKAAEAGKALNEARNVALIGRSFETETKAMDTGKRWAHVLRKAFAHTRIGADFGDRVARGFVTNAGLKWIAGDSDKRFLNDVHGVTAYECDPAPLFVNVPPITPLKGPSADRLLEVISEATNLGVVLSDREALAYDLFAASFSAGGSPDARFMLLMMAVETLIEPEPRDSEVIAHVEGMIAATKQSDLPKSEVASLMGSLEWLRSESIGQAGRKLATTLGDRRYMEGKESATQFFTKCYTLRSALAHGYSPRPSRDVVGGRAAALEGFVGDLLSVGLPPE